MNQDYRELVEYLDKKFNQVDEKFNQVDERFNQVDEKFNQVDKQFNQVDSRLGNLQADKADKEDVNNLLNAIDSYAKKADAYFEEMLSLSHKVDRHEKWFHQIADKLGIKLEY